MLPCSVYGSGDTTLVLMPFLGGSQLEWTESVAILSKHHRCITVDLPGFGDAASIEGYSVEEMASAVIDLLATLDLDRYLLVGHSMAGKVSAVVTRRLLDDPGKLHAPTGLILVTPSPPGPEPMTESKRAEMLEAFSGADEDDVKAARSYIKDNTTCVLHEPILDRTVHEVLRMNRAAWTAWLEHGSKEDWAERVGIISMPTLIMAAELDGSLGPAVQEKVTLPHFDQGHIVVIQCNHLAPLEQPEETAAMISNFLKVF